MSILAAILKCYREWAWFFWIGAWWVAVFVTMYCIGEADGATGSAQRSMEVEQEISGIAARCLIGAMDDVRMGLLFPVRSSGKKLAYADIPVSDVSLIIDNQPRTGWRSWGEAGWRIVGYIADVSWTPKPGTDAVVGGGRHDTDSVGYSYRLRIRGYDVRRATQIQDGRVVLTTDAWWVERVPVGRSTREIPIHVTIRITATERAGKTLLVGTAWGRADTAAFNCFLVRRFADRQAAATLREELGRALATVEREGLRMYAGSADLGPVLDSIGEAMRGVGRIRRGR